MSPYGMGAGLVGANENCGRTLHPHRACPTGHVWRVGGSCVGVIRSRRIPRPNHSVDGVGPTNERLVVLRGANLAHGLWCNWDRCRSGRLHYGDGVVRGLVGVVDK